MIEKLQGIFQNRQEFQAGLAAEPTVYHKGDIVRREEANGAYQLGVIKEVKNTGTPAETVTFEIRQDYDRRGELTGNFVGANLPIPTSSPNLVRMQAAPEQKGVLGWLKRR